jgi:hypothetical protein
MTAPTFDADAVVWNLDKVLNDKAPQFDAKQSAQVKPRIPSIASYASSTTARWRSPPRTSTRCSRTSCPGSWSPARRNGRSWAATGTSSPRSPPAPARSSWTSWCRASAPSWSRTPAYWDKNRIPKTDRIVLLPIPDALTRANALLNGQVDLIETPPPDMLPQLQSPASSWCRTSRRMSGRTTSARCPARPGPTSACARRSTWRSTATRWSSCSMAWRSPAAGQFDPDQPLVRQARVRSSTTWRRPAR